MGFGLPPSMADTDECWERACFWIAEVIEMHSDITRDTGSTATETGRLRYCIRGVSLVAIVTMSRGADVSIAPSPRASPFIVVKGLIALKESEYERVSMAKGLLWGFDTNSRTK